MSWLDFYQAVKRGDLGTIKDATEKDFRIGLTMDKSAIELAALYGHEQMFEYFLQKTDRTKDLQLLVKVLRDGLRGGHLEIVQKIVNFLDLKNYEKFIDGRFDFYLAAFEGGSIDCLKLVHELTKPICKNLYFQEIFFKIGSGEILEFMMKITGVHAEELASILRLPIHFIHIALNQWEPVLRTINNIKNWHETASTHTVVMGYNIKITPMDVAAHFGRLDILQKMVDIIKEDHSLMVFFRRNMTSTISYALRRNRREILEYLIEYGVAKPRPPCEYPGFEINDAFFYLEQEAEDLKVSKGKGSAFKNNFTDCLKVLYDYPYFEEEKPRPRGGKPAPERTKYWKKSNSASRLTKVDQFYDYLVRKWKWGLGDTHVNFDVLFMRALSEQNVDAALALEKMTKNLDCSTPDVHKYFKMMMSIRPRQYGFIQSPVIIELLMTFFLKGERKCQCEKWPADVCGMFQNCFLDGEFFVNNFSKLIEVPIGYVPNLPLQLLAKRFQVVFQVLANFGCEKPTGVADEEHENEIKAIVENLFRMSTSTSSLAAAVVLTIVQCCKFDVESIYTDDIKEWFGIKWLERDEFLTDFLIALSRNGWCLEPEDIGELELYFTSPRKRREHFVNLMQKTGIRIYCGRLEDYEAFPEYLELGECYYCEPRPKPTLQDWARFAVHKQCLTAADGRPAFSVSANQLVHDVSKLLPPRLARFLQYGDVYDKLDFEKDGYIAPGLIKKIDLERFEAEPSWGFDFDVFYDNYEEWAVQQWRAEFPNQKFEDEEEKPEYLYRIRSNYVP